MNPGPAWLSRMVRRRSNGFARIRTDKRLDQVQGHVKFGLSVDVKYEHALFVTTVSYFI